MSDGHSLSNEAAGAAKSAAKGVATQSACVEVLLSTPKSVLLPVEQLGKLTPYQYLSLSALTPSPSESVVLSRETDGMVALMAIDTPLLEELNGNYSKVVFNSPLLSTPMPNVGSVISLYGSTLYMRVANDGLRLAEVKEVSCDADILYYLSAIDRVYNIYNMYARAEGDTSRLQRVCKRLFKKLVCE